ncbi:MAG: uracil-DNA glycosylase [Ignavibacteria bacterium]
MKSGKNNIVSETIEYLKFIKRYNSFPLFNDRLLLEDILKKLDEIRNSDYTVEQNNLIDTLKPSVQKVKEEKVKTDVQTYIVEKGVTESDIEKANEVRDVTKQQNYKNIQELNSIVSDCKKCTLLSKERKNVVFGSGNINADLVVVGEAPGAEEDMQGLPFVGRAGKLLTDILKAVNFSREEVYICNILKCRPPENRNPMTDEISNCEPYLFAQLKLIKPKLILALGTFASQTLLRSKEPLGKLRGRFHLYEGIKMMVTYHPAALLRNPNWKKPTWEDVKMLRAEYDKMK